MVRHQRVSGRPEHCRRALHTYGTVCHCLYPEGTTLINPPRCSCTIAHPRRRPFFLLSSAPKNADHRATSNPRSFQEPKP
eukprot:148142-Chlamydomonas_euryale.AAC.2